MRRNIRYYDLYVNAPTVDGVGAKVDKWELMKTIPVIVNFTNLNIKTDDIRYKDCEYSGLSNLKGLDLSKQYKLVLSSDIKVQYIIKSINEFTRYSQYILQRVI